MDACFCQFVSTGVWYFSGCIIPNHLIIGGVALVLFVCLMYRCNIIMGLIEMLVRMVVIDGTALLLSSVFLYNYITSQFVHWQDVLVPFQHDI